MESYRKWKADDEGREENSETENKTSQKNKDHRKRRYMVRMGVSKRRVKE